MPTSDHPTPSNPAPSPPPDADDRHDRALVAQIRTEGIGRRSAWSELFTKYQDRLFTICLRMVHNRETAADLTQDAFVKVLQGLDSWDGRSRLSTWMIRVTMNVCLSHLRAAKLRSHAALHLAIAPSLARGRTGQSSGNVRDISGTSSGQVREPEPVQGVELQEQRQRVAAALARLDPEQRAIVVLRDVQGLDYDQIAATLNVATGTVKSRLFRARMALREQMERAEGEASGGGGGG
jgi:RNA polymerase sigma-70 factor, ECF subfamily